MLLWFEEAGDFADPFSAAELSRSRTGTSSTDMLADALGVDCSSKFSSSLSFADTGSIFGMAGGLAVSVVRALFRGGASGIDSGGVEAGSDDHVLGGKR